MATAHPLHQAIVAALKANAAVIARFGDRVYDTPPKEPVTPWVRIGEILEVRELADASKLYECYVDIHVFTTENKGLNWCRECCAIVATALDDAPLDPVGADMLEIFHRSTRAFLDVDGRTGHGIVNFRALTEI
jgi:hypothetical protein